MVAWLILQHHPLVELPVDLLVACMAPRQGVHIRMLGALPTRAAVHWCKRRFEHDWHTLLHICIPQAGHLPVRISLWVPLEIMTGAVLQYCCVTLTTCKWLFS
jgi:hypothetical protein